MKLHGIDFGHVFCASGARNFDGKGWWFHSFFRPFGLSYEGSTFVAKTTTLYPRKGNMELEGLQPKHRLPDCVVVKPFKGVVLNAVGLSGPGARNLLTTDVWRNIEQPFFISFMATASDPTVRLQELKRFLDILSVALPAFQAPVGLQLNFSCPNVCVKPEDIGAEMLAALTMANTLCIPVVPKVNVLTPIEALYCIEHDCDAISVSNTIPWSQLDHLIHWKKLFGTDVSPLWHYGGGGLSGAPLLPIVCSYITRLKAENAFKTPVIGGGGILSKWDADEMIDAGADAIELGSVAILRPWRVQGIIKHVNRRLNRAARIREGS